MPIMPGMQRQISVVFLDNGYLVEYILFEKGETENIRKPRKVFVYCKDMNEVLEHFEILRQNIECCNQL